MYRFAPSPTGDMHIGNLRAALFNYIKSRQENIDFILRIEDTDNVRNIAGKEEEIKDILTKFGITWQHYYVQSENLKFHRQMALKLVSEKKAFACFCTEDDLAKKKELAKSKNQAYRYDGTCEKLSDIDVLNCEKPFVIRLKKPCKEMKFMDFIKGEITFNSTDIDSFVIMRADKTPTYNFACAIDDMLEGVTCIIRGEDHVSNTPKQEHIRASLDYDKNMTYAHLPIILNEDGVKMSKREAHSSVKWMLDNGYLASAIANYLILLGNKTPKEIFTLEEAIEWFDLSKISKSPARFDTKRLMQINREHIKMLDDNELNKYLQFGQDVAQLAKFYTQEASTLNEIKEKIQMIFSSKNYEEFVNECNLIKGVLIDQELPMDYETFKKDLMEKTALKGKNFFMPLRLVLTGVKHGPELSDLYTLIRPFIQEIIRK
ncbi:glutamate--tRNA ligase [Campylobacter insulaenigrae]|uniref:glutamate--tRNA ligase n=1 Tax=Campylobacter insulaenigrae TaxID=260714 RepID=UPI0021533123|nr:glutamate--tRNA ligase [Campylobacter insulaenigrae]MCR6570138.1 glutamate--tRNA ligase [Campylobacter insulaenigrae]MCR6573181.1 glutamate--tRNA ligase [Campylobacter insulaenigrae]MCR6579931.1 glutamate--tRNA ligase [Campylobacter insulaenigrae]MCR6585545.1 glutamate--tRNA ligase [Campylobacter insulaenigrae]MCR6587060.1 glutamate--tRNA ligase [Campylobacter insulaenigrae]